MSSETTKHQLFTSLYQKSYDKVRRQAAFLCRNKSEAEDVTQEAFLRAYRHFDKCIDVAMFENWVLKIAKNVFLDLQRYKSRRVQQTALTHESIAEEFEAHLIDDRPNPEEEYMNEQIDPEIIAAINQLPTEQREMLWQLVVEQADYSEIASRYGIPVGSVKSRIFRACQRLRNTYLPHFVAKRGLRTA